MIPAASSVFVKSAVAVAGALQSIPELKKYGMDLDSDGERAASQKLVDVRQIHITGGTEPDDSTRCPNEKNIERGGI